MKVRSKVWLDAKGGLSFGPGRARILVAVSETGSINAAAEKLGISYRRVWGYINDAEKRLGRKLLTRARGGSRGGGAELTDYAVNLCKKYERLEKDVTKYAEKRYASIFNV